MRKLRLWKVKQISKLMYEIAQLGLSFRLDHTEACSVQFSLVTQPCLTLCNPMDCSTPGFSVHPQLPYLTQTHVCWVGDAIQPSHPLSSPSPTFNLSQHQGLFKFVLRIRWPKYWSFSFSISPSSEYSGLISFRMDWLDLLAVQDTLKSLLQHHTVQKHQFFDAQLSLQSNSHIHTWPLEKPQPWLLSHFSSVRLCATP